MEVTLSAHPTACGFSEIPEHMGVAHQPLELKTLANQGTVVHRSGLKLPKRMKTDDV